MQTASIRAALVAIFMIGDAAAAQARPDFSGRWIVPIVAPTSTAAPDAGTGWGPSVIITQTGTKLQVEYPYFTRGDLQPSILYTYALDSTRTVNSYMMGRGTQREESFAWWQAQTIQITTTQSFADVVPGQAIPVTVRRTLSLASPTTLIVETTRGGVLGGASSTTRTAYQKAP